MHDVNCYLCASSKKSLLFLQAGHDPYLDQVSSDLHAVERGWYICDACGFVFRSPALSSDEIAQLYANYEQHIFRTTTPDAYFDRIISIPDADSENTAKTLWLQETLQQQKEQQGGRSTENFPRTILDVGCGGGTLLHTIGNHFPQAALYGVELNTPYAELAARRVQATVLNTEYKSGLFDKRFDLILFTKVLEHIPEPLTILREMAQDLSDDGLLFVEVPDISDLYSLPPDHGRFQIPHIHYYSENTLTTLLNRAGMDVVISRSIYKIASQKRSYLQILAKTSKNRIDIENLTSNEIVSLRKRIQTHMMGS
ncbi:MAG: class I SAM-dependent methyltransferase [Magnetococcales bacterium]|nr:class I SAM-dependent methyltransferase [Magnetococcales bacterium]